MRYENYSRVFVQEAYHSCTLLVLVVFFADLARLGDLPRVIIPADRIHSPEADTLDCPLFLSQPLASESVYCPLEVFVCDILLQFAQLVRSEVRKSLEGGWGRRGRWGVRGGLSGWEDAVFAEGIIAGDDELCARQGGGWRLQFRVLVCH